MSIEQEPDPHILLDLPPVWTHVYVSTLRNDPGELDSLLRLVADDVAPDVILSAKDFAWLYAPYDGGGDVIARTREQRDQLGQRLLQLAIATPLGTVIMAGLCRS